MILPDSLWVSAPNWPSQSINSQSLWVSAPNWLSLSIASLCMNLPSERPPRRRWVLNAPSYLWRACFCTVLLGRGIVLYCIVGAWSVTFGRAWEVSPEIRHTGGADAFSNTDWGGGRWIQIAFHQYFTIENWQKSNITVIFKKVWLDYVLLVTLVIYKPEMLWNDGI